MFSWRAGEGGGVHIDIFHMRFSSLAKHFHFLYEGAVVNGLKEGTTFHFRFLKRVREMVEREGREKGEVKRREGGIQCHTEKRIVIPSFHKDLTQSLGNTHAHTRQATLVQ